MPLLRVKRGLRGFTGVYGEYTGNYRGFTRDYRGTVY